MNRILFALLLAAQAVAAGAQEVIKPGEERFTLMLGGFLPAFKTKLNVDDPSTGSAGSRVDLKDDLGVDQDTSGGWFGAEWRFAQRHRFGLTYSRFTLRGERTIDRTLQIGDEQFPIGGSLSSQLQLEIIPLTYSYSIVKRERDELALTAGLHWSHLSFAVQGSASLDTRDFSNDASAKANVPLPLLGVRYDHHFSDRWSAGGSLGVFALKYGKDTTNFEGDLWSARLHAEYRFAKNFGIGAALDGFKVSVEASQNQWKGGFDYGYWGPQLYLTARF